MEISGNSRRLFAELCSDGGTLARIDRIFQAEGLTPKEDYDSRETGQRRSLVGAYHANVDFGDPAAVRALLRVYAAALDEFGQGTDYLERNAQALLRSLKRDGVAVEDGEIVVPDVSEAEVSFPLDDYGLLGEPDTEAIREHLRRIERGIQVDPGAAIGSAKELLETVCKLILDAEQISYARGDDLPQLYRKVAEQLKLNAEAVPESARGSQAAQKALRSLVTSVQSLAELRNQLGLGHGRTRKNPALKRHGQLAFNATRTVAEFLLQTWHARREEVSGVASS